MCIKISSISCWVGSYFLYAKSSETNVRWRYPNHCYSHGIQMMRDDTLHSAVVRQQSSDISFLCLTNVAMKLYCPFWLSQRPWQLQFPSESWNIWWFIAHLAVYNLFHFFRTINHAFIIFCICIYLFGPIIIHMIADWPFIIPFRLVTLFTEPTHTIYTDKFIKFLYTL